MFTKIFKRQSDVRHGVENLSRAPKNNVIDARHKYKRLEKIFAQKQEALKTRPPTIESANSVFPLILIDKEPYKSAF